MTPCAVTRRHLLAAAAASFSPLTAFAQGTPPQLGRIKAATVGCTDVSNVSSYYETLLYYRVVEQGTISPGLAVSWGTPMSIGCRYTVLQPATGAAVFVRLVEIDGIDGFRGLPPGVAMATFTVPDLDALDLGYITPPGEYDGVVNDGQRSAVFMGPVGELVELVEAPR